MSCPDVKKLISEYIDQSLTEQERILVDRHLASCPECSAESEEMLQVCSAMRSLPRLRPPQELSIRLRMLASRERARRAAGGALAVLTASGAARLRLFFENLMRPLALPFAGGFLSAVFLFGALAPSLNVSRNITNDVATPIYQEARVDMMPELIGKRNGGEDALIEVMVDANGRVTDFAVTEGEMTPEIGNLILFTQYQPARVFFQPTGGKIFLRRSRITVKG